MSLRTLGLSSAGNPGGRMRASIVDQLILLAPVAHRDADLVGRNPKAL
jgi:hypothetical protein